MREFNKLFGVGLSRTGTTSLSTALKILGITSHHFHHLLAHDLENRLTYDRMVVDMFQALSDTPIALFYKELDRDYPGSVFILTMREEAEWARSWQNHIERNYLGWDPYTHEMHVKLYGSQTFDEKLHLAHYVMHNRSVKDYFANRQGDLLTIDICAGEGWEKLCPFLGLDIPDAPFPHANHGDYAVARR